MRDRVLVGPWVDDEQEIPLLHGLVVDYVKLYDPARDFRDDVDDVGHHGRVVGLRMPDDTPDDHHGQQEGTRDDHDAEHPAYRTATGDTHRASPAEQNQPRGED